MEHRSSEARAEFTVEPFVDGSPGPHVRAALDAVTHHGFEPEIGPFGTSISGHPADVVTAIGSMLDEARKAGATRVSVQIDFDPDR